MIKKKLLSSAGIIVSMAAILAGCGSNTASVEPVTEAQTQAFVKQDIQEITTEATTEAPTEAPTEAATEAATEIQTEAATEAQVETVAETQAIVASTSSGSNLGNRDYGLISNVTSDTIVKNADGTVSTPYGTYSSVTAYNIANDCTDSDNPNHMAIGGYLSSDKRMKFLILNKDSSWWSTGTVDGIPLLTYLDMYNITDEDLKNYNITITNPNAN